LAWRAAGAPLTRSSSWFSAPSGATPASAIALPQPARSWPQQPPHAPESTTPGRFRLTIQCQPVLDSKPADRRRRDSTHEPRN
jgi:hypothetical protein